MSSSIGVQRELTVFFIACNDNNPNYADCLHALRSQKPAGLMRVEHIYNKAPMNVAFQEMLDRCTTKFFIQCDQDMILHPSACAVMLDDIRAQSQDVAMVAYMLHDPHLDMNIQGVKIYRHSIVKNYPFVSGLSCERSQVDRFRADGFTLVERSAVLGQHSPRWNPELVFERYFDLMEKWKKFGYTWLEDLPRKLMNKMLADPSEVNRFAFLGAWASASRREVLRTREKDFQVRTAEYMLARGWFCPPTQATLYLTDKCNLKCSWCLRQGDMSNVTEAPPLDASVIDELKSRFPTINSVCLCGFGETLMHPNLEAIVERCHRHNLWAGLITNGVMLQDALPMLLKCRPSCISISLNASCAEEHAAETGMLGAWDKVMAGIEAIAAHRSTLRLVQSRDMGIPLYLSRVCTKQNLTGIPSFLSLAKKLGVVAGVDLHNVLPHDVGTPEKEAAFLETVLTVRDRQVLEAFKQLPGAELVRNWPVLIDTAFTVRRCSSPTSTIAVDGNRLYSICNSVMPPQYENGTIRNARCWQSNYSQDLRQSFAEPCLPAWCKWCFRNFV